MNDNFVMAGFTASDMWTWLANFFSSNDLAIVQAYLPQIVVSVILGALIGLERRYRAKQAGVRTYVVLTVTACLIAVTGYHIWEVTMAGDPTRLAHGVLTGVGFVGAGVIVVRGWSASGVTTSATILLSVGVGVACGMGMQLLAAVATVITLAFIAMSYFIFPTNDFGGNTVRVVCPIDKFKDARKLFGIQGASYRIDKIQKRNQAVEFHVVTTLNSKKLESLIARQVFNDDITSIEIIWQPSD